MKLLSFLCALNLENPKIDKREVLSTQIVQDDVDFEILQVLD